MVSLMGNDWARQSELGLASLTVYQWGLWLEAHWEPNWVHWSGELKVLKWELLLVRATEIGWVSNLELYLGELKAQLLAMLKEPQKVQAREPHLADWGQCLGVSKERH